MQICTRFYTRLINDGYRHVEVTLTETDSQLSSGESWVSLDILTHPALRGFMIWIFTDGIGRSPGPSPADHHSSSLTGPLARFHRGRFLFSNAPSSENWEPVRRLQP